MKSVSDRIKTKKAFITSAVLGSNEVVAAIPNCRIILVSAVVVTTAANSIKFLSAATDISATWPLAANGGFSMTYNPDGWMETEVNEALNVNLSAATSTGVHITYLVEFDV